ncbi:hypothetical protein K493DRAFT_110095 [Basidiobolus meristosporus CBS 931.73]|uniref:PAN2-PAN3 deadenylation complex subunit PAN3 n=1 Tax=Basidiobolus meristosporus CBS 931.73 TaxID=1314790 RepID=A0A1Y1YNA0_9FUNG|nr:hypothetical protein K493DRAFT_110095 [Basidiobolus meristosporus CBS 931.73]|eukprot:ORX99458.1 hypothetical protein K493DRAFT_110095 [Basidiobolus meristosporus CBS 931.73]
MNPNPSYILQPPLGSSAIPIVAPPVQNQGPKETNIKDQNSGQTTPSSQTRTCRNVIIHGYCKYEGKGCDFKHDMSSATPFSFTSPDSTKLRVTSPAFNPIGSSNPMLASNTAIINRESSTNQGPNELGSEKGASGFATDNHQNHSATSFHPTTTTAINSSANTLNFGPMGLDDGKPIDHLQPNLQYHHYTSPSPLTSNLPPNRKTIHSFFLSDELREELQKRNEATNHYAQDSSMPSEVNTYHSLSLLDNPKIPKSKKLFGYSTSVYKAVSSNDEKPYVLRRVENFRLANETAMSTIDNWRKISHPNIVSVREAFTTRAFGDYSLVFVYDYHPYSTTLADKHLSQLSSNTLAMRTLPEKELWSIIIQIVTAIRTLHAAGLAACILDLTKILVTGNNRIRLNCCGIYEVLSYASTRNTIHYQQEDLLQLGQLLTCLACGTFSALSNLPKSIDYISRNYTPDVKNVILYLLSKPSAAKNIDDAVAIMGSKILLELNHSHHYNDFLETGLSGELVNDRSSRLMMKLGFINERPEFDLDPSWSETGDRYLIKLFRDYVFHQVDENGNPVLDVGHVLSCLNKLDAGVDEKIMLMSRDEQSCLIVSYKELKNCIDQAFSELARHR